MSQATSTSAQPAFWINRNTVEISKIDLRPTPYLTPERLARTAKQIQKDEGLGYTAALDEAARRAGYQDAKHVRAEAQKAQGANHLKCLQRLALKVAICNLFKQYEKVEDEAGTRTLPQLSLDQLVADFCAGRVDDAYMERTGLYYRRQRMDSADDTDRSTIHQWRVDYYASLYLDFYQEEQVRASTQRLDRLPETEARHLAMLFASAERFWPDHLHEDVGVDAVAALDALAKGKYPTGSFYPHLDDRETPVIEPLHNSTESEEFLSAEALYKIAEEEASDMMRFYHFAFDECPAV